MIQAVWSYIFDNPLQVLGTAIGILYLIQEIKASKWMWLSSIIMPIISLFVYWKAGLYADFGIDIYYVIIAIYGFCAWAWGGRSGGSSEGRSGTGSDSPGHHAELPISRTPLKLWPVLMAATVVIFFIIRWILVTYTDSTVPNADSFTTTLSIVAMVMLSRKWIEQWWVWAIVDAVSTGLYIYKGIYGYAGLYAVYTVLAFYGYFRWKKQMQAGGPVS